MAILAALVRPASDAGASRALRDALQCAAREAREQQVPPQSLLATLRETWESLPDVRAVAEPQARRELLRAIAVRSIREYFAAADTPLAE